MLCLGPNKLGDGGVPVCDIQFASLCVATRIPCWIAARTKILICHPGNQKDCLIYTAVVLACSVAHALIYAMLDHTPHMHTHVRTPACSLCVTYLQEATTKHVLQLM